MDRSSLAAGRGGGRAMDSARHGLLSLDERRGERGRSSWENARVEGLSNPVFRFFRDIFIIFKFEEFCR
jgi:hypothetical protein